MLPVNNGVVSVLSALVKRPWILVVFNVTSFALTWILYQFLIGQWIAPAVPSLQNCRRSPPHWREW